MKDRKIVNDPSDARNYEELILKCVMLMFQRTICLFNGNNHYQLI